MNAVDRYEKREQGSQTCGFKHKYLKWIKDVTVEPTMYLYMMAFMVTSVVEQAFFVHKACRVDHGYSEEVCQNLTDNETLKAMVQVTVSDFHQWNNIAGHVVPIILALFCGNWSDRRGRKLPLILGLIGKFIYSSMIVVNSLISTWSLNMVIYTATLPMAMLGGDVAIFANCFTYVSDVSSVRQRTLRITILDIAYLSTMPTGVALGAYLYTNVVNSSYSIMFVINATLLALAILYSMVRLKWQTSSDQQSLRGVNALTDFFDTRHVEATVTTLTRPREYHGRLHLWIILLAMVLYTFQRDERPMAYLYTQLIFKWDVKSYSQFKTFQSALFVVAMLIGVPVMSKVLGMKDTTIMAIGTLSHAGGRIVFALAEIPELFYVGAAVAALGPVVAPVLRSMTSKAVPTEERGKIFAMLSVCDNAVPLFSSILYSQVYNATITTIPSSIFWLTFATQVAVLLLVLLIQGTTRSDGLVGESYIDNEIAVENSPDTSENYKTSVNGNENIRRLNKGPRSIV